MYSNVEIESALSSGNLIIENYIEECLRPSSYLLRINNTIFEEKKDNGIIIDTKSTNTQSLFNEIVIDNKGYMLKPNTLYLFSSVERVSLTNELAGILNLLSSLARIGLCANFSSNLVAATFGCDKPSSITFEVANLSSASIIIYPYVKFCHISFFEHKVASSLIYNGIYSGHDLPKPADFSKKPSK
ncbi:dCTP deaminase [Desulfosporosinus nitroreducens]|uniref:Deoxycytidine triphosphate deaminase n=1 Tax=Desulfosporosinus nitroreducens TaxID=2018668 RepID=A0ABT8QJ14_9FIRM|nr:hypothetical protein [Desulfosporosinus nitroreducens]MDO0821302.1 hypothetical protein [Desulfosporosinus nitroreducens]